MVKNGNFDYRYEVFLLVKDNQPGRTTPVCEYLLKLNQTGGVSVQ